VEKCIDPLLDWPDPAWVVPEDVVWTLRFEPDFKSDPLAVAKVVIHRLLLETLPDAKPGFIELQLGQTWWVEGRTGIKRNERTVVCAQAHTLGSMFSRTILFNKILHIAKTLTIDEFCTMLDIIGQEATDEMLFSFEDSDMGGRIGW
jgi:hypothetical protein